MVADREEWSGPAMPWAARLLLALLVVAGVAWLLNLHMYLGISLIDAEYLGIVAALTTAAGFLLYPWRAGRAGVPDYLLAAAALASWGWMAFNYSEWLLDLGNRGPEKWLPGVVALALLVEAVRRACGNAIAVLILLIMAYAFLGHHLPGMLEGSRTSPERLVLYLYADSNGVPGLVLNVAATVVLGFIVFGAVLQTSGGADLFTRLGLAAMGRFRGGPAKVSIVASGMFGSVSGSTVANVMSTGVITIPLMKRSGFPAHYAAGVEAVASNGGQLAPPVMGATAFLIAEFLQVPYREVALAALIPAIIYYVVLFLQVDLFAARHGLAGLPRSELPRIGAELRRGGWFLLPLILLIYLLFFLNWTPGRAALTATAACLALDLIGKRRLPGPRYLIELTSSAGATLVPLLLISAAAGIVIGALNISGIGFTLTMKLAGIGEAYGVLALLLVCAFASIVLGMGMPTAAVYVVLSVLLAPAMVEAGIAPMAAHMFILYFGLLSMITPPVAVASFAAGGLAEADMWRTGLAGLKLASAAYLLPFVFAFNPALLMQGSAIEILLAFGAMVVTGYLLGLAFSDERRIPAALYFAAAAALCVVTAKAEPDSALIGVAAALGLVAARGLRFLFQPVPLKE